jgi:riboflavin kinase/FMN adenylyltransferase
MNKKWRKGVVVRGNQIGRTIGFPTINLDPALMEREIEGVYACFVRIDDTIYKGALFYGKRTVVKDEIDVLEINILDFHGDIYFSTVSFQLFSFIREPGNLINFDVLRRQIARDIEKIRKLMTGKKPYAD